MFAEMKNVGEKESMRLIVALVLWRIMSLALIVRMKFSNSHAVFLED